jgi:hypothetical protein
MPVKGDVHVEKMTSESSLPVPIKATRTNCLYEEALSSSSSFTTSPSPPLSRSSSYCSTSTTCSDSYPSDGENDADDDRLIIGILKKPHQSCTKQTQDEEYEDDEGSGSRSEVELEVDIVFERNVTFDDPLATDIATGAVVPPSSRTRQEWIAMLIRASLESLEKYSVFDRCAPRCGGTHEGSMLGERTLQEMYERKKFSGIETWEGREGEVEEIVEGEGIQNGEDGQEGDI